MINLTSNRAKQRHQVKVIRMMLILVFVQQKEIARILNRIYLEIAKNIEMNNRGITLPIEIMKRRLNKTLLRHYKRIGRVFSRDAFKTLERLGTKKNVDMDELIEEALPFGLETKQPEEVTEFWKSFNSWAATQAASKVVKISSTTRTLISSIINRGLEDNLSNREIAKKIRTAGIIANKKRALMIARTETHTGAVFAQDEVVNTVTKKLGIKMDRFWSTMKDLRVRPAPGIKSKFNHRKADGQKRAQKKAFNVSGEKLIYPGDPSGSPGNIINCRCVVLYKIKKKLRRAA